MLQRFARDVRLAIRQFAQPAFTQTTLLVLSFGLGANSAIFIVVNTFLLRLLHHPYPERLVAVNEFAIGKSGAEKMARLPGMFLDRSHQAQSFEGMTAARRASARLSSPDNTFQPRRVEACNCLGNLLAMLGISPSIDHAFRPDGDRSGCGNARWAARPRSSPNPSSSIATAMTLSA